MNESIEADVFELPFPHLILRNFYNKEELDLIWEELILYKTRKTVRSERLWWYC